jgi:Fur family transcriptional regulator, ferric uptake regulator
MPSQSRDTRQRRAVREVFETADRPIGPQEVLARAEQKVPGLGIATVYRTIRALVEKGWLHPVQLTGESPRYERAGMHHHHHFHCRGCDGVYDVAGCPPDVTRLAPPGFVLEQHEIVLRGLCSACG